MPETFRPNPLRLAFGLMRLPKNPDGSIDIPQVCEMADRFIAAGGTYFDTAWAYPGSEDAMREALGVEVAYRREAAEVRVLDRERDVHRGGDAADADHAHVDFLVGKELAYVQPAVCGKDERKCGGRGSAEELATVNVH